MKKKQNRKYNIQTKTHWGGRWKKIILYIPYCCIIFFIGIIYIYAERIYSSIANLTDICIKNIGFKVETIKITKTAPDNASYHMKCSQQQSLAIKNQLGLQINDNIFKLSVKHMYNNIMQIPNIKTVTIRKNLPNTIAIEFTEKVPICIWQKNGKLFLSDKDGSIVSDANSSSQKLPIVTGADANLFVYDILKIIYNFPIIKTNLESMTFIKKRRWNIVVRGIQFKLPESNLEYNMKIIDSLIRNPNIDSDINFIDLRMPENIIINR